MYTVDTNTSRKCVRRDPAAILDALKIKGKWTSGNHVPHTAVLSQICSTKKNECLFLFLFSLKNCIKIKCTYSNKFKECFPWESRFGCNETSCHITDQWKLDSYAGKHPWWCVATKFELTKKGTNYPQTFVSQGDMLEVKGSIINN